MKTKTKTKKPKPQPKQKKLAPLWKHGNTSLVLLVVVIVAIVAGGVGWMLARNALAPVDQAQLKTGQLANKPSAPISQPQQDGLGKTIGHKDINDCVSKGGSINNMDNECYVNTEQSKEVDGTANWQTYRNDAFGYSIKYPSDHTVYSKVEKDVLVKALSSDDFVNIAENEELAKFSEPLLLQFQGIKTNQSSMEWFNANVAKYYSGRIASQEQTVFAGQKALKITASGDGGPGARYRTIVIEKAGGLVVIFQDKSAFLDKILSTFTFAN